MNPASFHRGFFQSRERVARIGGGSLGGKAQGLLRMAALLEERLPPDKIPGFAVDIPRMVVLGTDFFDAFMDLNLLHGAVEEAVTDGEIARAFHRASLPPRYSGDLRAMAETVTVPLAVRSSSLLEDARAHPFAGVYGTKMIPNGDPSVDARFRQLTDAVKYVMATTFFAQARAYLRGLDEDPGAEKMAVIIQEVVGRRHGDHFYPTISGVGRTWNAYPTGHGGPADGVVDLALGLGKTIVDGGRAWSYCPAYPRSPRPFNNLRDLLSSTQTTFWSVNMGRPPIPDPMEETEYLLRSELDVADYDNTLRFVASTVDQRSGRIIPSVSLKGPRVLDFAPILKLGDVPLNDVVKELLAGCRDLAGGEAEMEFAADLHHRDGLPARVGFLQVRPMVISREPVDVPWEAPPGWRTLVRSRHALGNGTREDIADIVFLDQGFQPPCSAAILKELEELNDRLVAERRPYMLVGPGRWGTSDSWCGVPVVWGQISGARVIVEVSLPGMEPDLSQGSHFFHNVTSFQVFYLSVPARSDAMVDWGWLESRQASAGGGHVRHVRLAAPVRVLVDGRVGRGAAIVHD